MCLEDILGFFVSGIAAYFLIRILIGLWKSESGYVSKTFIRCLFEPREKEYSANANLEYNMLLITGMLQRSHKKVKKRLLKTLQRLQKTGKWKDMARDNIKLGKPLGLSLALLCYIDPDLGLKLCKNTKKIGISEQLEFIDMLDENYERHIPHEFSHVNRWKLRIQDPKKNKPLKIVCTGLPI